MFLKSNSSKIVVSPTHHFFHFKRYKKNASLYMAALKLSNQLTQLATHLANWNPISLANWNINKTFREFTLYQINYNAFIQAQIRSVFLVCLPHFLAAPIINKCVIIKFIWITIIYFPQCIIIVDKIIFLNMFFKQLCFILSILRNNI